MEENKQKTQERPLRGWDIFIVLLISLPTVIIESMALMQYLAGSLGKTLFVMSALMAGMCVIVIIWWRWQWIKLETGKYSVVVTIGGGFLYPVTGKNNSGLFNNPRSVNYDHHYDEYEWITTTDPPGASGQKWDKPDYKELGSEARTWVDDRPWLERNLGYYFPGFMTKKAAMLVHTHEIKSSNQCSQDEKNTAVFSFNDNYVIENKEYVQQRPLYWSDVIIIMNAETGAGSKAGKKKTEEDAEVNSGHEEAQMLSVNVVIKAQFRVRNIFTMFTKNVDTHHSALGVLDAYMRDFIGNSDIDALLTGDHTGIDSRFKKLIEKANKDLINGFGYEMTAQVFFTAVEPADEASRKMMKSQQNIFIAKKDSEALVIKATGEGDAAQAKANGEAKAYTTLKTAQTNADKKYNEEVSAHPDLRIKYENMAKLAEVKGTLVLTVGEDEKREAPKTIVTVPTKSAAEREETKTKKASAKNEEKGGAHEHH